MKTIRMTLLLAVLIFATSSYAGRPKVGLALGGGGAKGAAEIGVLKVIEKVGIKIDYIAGTSIGSIIGGLYSSGYSSKEIEKLFLSQEWQDILEGQLIETKLKSLLSKKGVEKFSDTRIPFKCVAAENESFKEVILSNGLVYKAIRASMSVPLIYEPVKWGNKNLVDGGVINNLPVDVVRNMGADIVIAIDLQQGNEFIPGISLKQLFGIDGLADWFSSRPDVRRRSENVKDADVYINPRLQDFTAASFSQGECEIMLKIGEEKAMDMWDELMEIKNRQR